MACLCAIHFDVYPCVNLPFQIISGLPHRRCLQESQEFASALATLPSKIPAPPGIQPLRHPTWEPSQRTPWLHSPYHPPDNWKTENCWTVWMSFLVEGYTKPARICNICPSKVVQVSLSNRPPPSTSTVCNRVTEKAVWFVICLSPGVVWFVTKAPQSAFAELPGPWPEWRRLKSHADHPFHATNQNRNIYYFAVYLGKTCWISGYFRSSLGGMSQHPTLAWLLVSPWGFNHLHWSTTPNLRTSGRVALTQ